MNAPALRRAEAWWLTYAITAAALENLGIGMLEAGGEGLGGRTSRSLPA